MSLTVANIAIRSNMSVYEKIGEAKCACRIIIDGDSLVIIA